ncbi:MAG TPA: c-type cytochrome, partial [Anaerolineales bacterium]
HVSMPAWQGTLSQADQETLAAYVTNPSFTPAGQTLFSQHCSTCHGERVPTAPNIETARKIIGTGGPHVTMPVWGNILTSEQLNALVQYTLVTSQGKGPEQGAHLFANNCASCHGQIGQGGPNPGRPNDMIPPINSTEFLNTRDDVTLRNIISQGQPDLGMNQFGSTYGGPLSDDQIGAIITFLRSSEASAPTPEASGPLPVTPEPTTTTSAPSGPVTFSGQVLPIFQAKCEGCHNSSTKLGGWDASSYDSVMTTGDNGPVLTAGDLKQGLLAQFLLGTDGKFMPPSGSLPQGEILTILDWIAAGANNN